MTVDRYDRGKCADSAGCFVHSPSPYRHDVNRSTQLRVEYLLTHYATGDGERVWLREAKKLTEVHWDHLAALEADIKANGMRNPIRLTPLGEHPKRVIDGHHRLIVAAWLDMEMVPVTYGYDWQDAE